MAIHPNRLSALLCEHMIHRLQKLSLFIRRIIWQLYTFALNTDRTIRTVGVFDRLTPLPSKNDRWKSLLCPIVLTCFVAMFVSSWMLNIFRTVRICVYAVTVVSSVHLKKIYFKRDRQKCTPGDSKAYKSRLKPISKNIWRNLWCFIKRNINKSILSIINKIIYEEMCISLIFLIHKIGCLIFWIMYIICFLYPVFCILYFFYFICISIK